MTWTDWIDGLAIAAFAGLLLAAAIVDFRNYTIPNAIPLAIALLYPAHALFVAAPVDWAGALITASAVFAVGAAFFALKMTGGGDVKLLGAVALWAGPGLILPFLVITGLAGGALGLAMLSWLRVFRPRRYVVLGDCVTRVPLAKANLPYGVAIAAGGAFVAATLLAIPGP